MRAGEEMDVRGMSPSQLAARCGEETEKYRSGHPYSSAWCFELCRRAIAENDQVAWAQLVSQYSNLVLAWTLRHPVRASVGEDDEYWVNDAFRRFWQATRSKRFENFESLPGVLSFLKTCVHSAIMDGMRRKPPTPPWSLTEMLEDDGKEPVEPPVDRMGPAELWEAVKRALPDESERLVVYLRVGLGLSPREIPLREPTHFPTVQDVYRIYRNALDRLRRNDEIRNFFD